MTPADLASAAADLLEADGWIQEDYERKGEGRCLVGAVRTALYGGDDWSADEYLTEITVLERVVPESFRGDCGIGSAALRWNDDPNRTAGEVISRLRSVAEEFSHADR